MWCVAYLLLHKNGFCYILQIYSSSLRTYLFSNYHRCTVAIFFQNKFWWLYLMTNQEMKITYIHKSATEYRNENLSLRVFITRWFLKQSVHSTSVENTDLRSLFTFHVDPRWRFIIPIFCNSLTFTIGLEIFI